MIEEEPRLLEYWEMNKLLSPSKSKKRKKLKRRTERHKDRPHNKAKKFWEVKGTKAGYLRIKLRSS